MHVELVRVKVNTNFGFHTTGEELLVENNVETRRLVKRGYFEEIAIERTPVKKAVAKVVEESTVEPKKPVATKPKTRAKAKKGS